MSSLSDRIRSLTPEQQELLHRRLQYQERLEPETTPASRDSAATIASLPRKIDFSLFFFSADGTADSQERYKLLIESARFADRNGFNAVWTPERHFQAFGGLYPNPAVLSAALAMITENVQIRAGSVVLPLHSPVRVAEDWALVDNLSRGRVAISFATGWHQHDYVIAPHAYEDRRERMFRDIQIVRRLWAGQAVELPGVDGQKTLVKTLPRPIQSELPFWVTVTSPSTWRRAGEIGANVLTAFVGTTPEDLRGQILDYRRARLENGHDPRSGIVSLMLHTYLGTDVEAIREKVREPLKRYLQSFIDQFRPLMKGGLSDASSHEMQSLLDFAFERYFEDSSLLGTPEKCLGMLGRLSDAGVNEAACLIDFGLSLDDTMESLELLAVLRQTLDREIAANAEKELAR
ncbi:MAG TPA: MupA/Atu3671 family FMN-dependent luciferase-like monooxygenase [Candidatus Angelobacter sp.]